MVGLRVWTYRGRDCALRRHSFGHVVTLTPGRGRPRGVEVAIGDQLQRIGKEEPDDASPRPAPPNPTRAA